MPDHLRNNRRLFVGTQPQQPAFKSRDELIWSALRKELEAQGLPVPPRMPDYPNNPGHPSMNEFKVADTPQAFLARLLANPRLTPERRQQLLGEFDRGEGYGHAKAE